MTFILVEPEYAQNVGAAARALKTMGFRKLVLVNPLCYPSDEARWVAHGSQDILDEARIVPDLASLRPEFDWLVVTTKEGRHLRVPNVPLRSLPAFAAERAWEGQRIGLVFGREAYGLSNDEIHLGDVTSSIPLAAPYPALNLAQCVMLYAYAFAELTAPAADGAEAPPVPSAAAEGEAFRRRVAGALQRLGLAPGKKAYEQLMARLPAVSFRDMRLLQHLLDRFDTHEPRA